MVKIFLFATVILIGNNLSMTMYCQERFLILETLSIRMIERTTYKATTVSVIDMTHQIAPSPKISGKAYTSTLHRTTPRARDTINVQHSVS